MSVCAKYRVNLAIQQTQGTEQIGRPALEVAAESLQEILDWQTAIEEVRVCVCECGWSLLVCMKQREREGVCECVWSLLVCMKHRERVCVSVQVSLNKETECESV